jgi:hypothetical protein
VRAAAWARIRQRRELRENISMTDSVKHTWYVAFEVPTSMSPPGRRGPRATETFPNESEAREFARKKFAEGLNVNAGTINPHLPKRAIASTEIHRWLEETWGQQ